MNKPQLGAGFFQELAKLKRAIYHQLNAVKIQCQENILSLPEKNIRLARTILDEGVYPAADDSPNTYKIELGSGTFTEAAGQQTLTFTPYSPAVERYAHALCLPYIPQGTVILVNLVSKRYYVTGFAGGAVTAFRVTNTALQYKQVDSCLVSDWKDIPSTPCTE